MSQLLTPANLDDVIKPIHTKKSTEFSKTQKNQNKLSGILKTLQEMDDDDTNNIGDFSPPPKPISAGTQKTTDSVNQFINDNSRHRIPPVAAVTSGSPGLELNNLKYTYPSQPTNADYYKKYINNTNDDNIQTNPTPTYNNIGYSNPEVPVPTTTAYTHAYTGSGVYQDKSLTDKLNYMIHLLEDKQDVKSNSKWEEIGLYCLLGVFTIFLVDSFSKVGKYVR
jgi:hypothetical protein